MRAPYDGSQWNGNTSLVGSPTISTAASRSNTTGRSQNTASVSVMAKSWIIVGPGTGTSVLDTSVPSASATWYVRYGGTKP